MTEPLLTEAGLAELLGVSARTIRAWLSDRGLPCYRIGRTVRFRASEIERWLRRYHRGSSASASSAADCALPSADLPPPSRLTAV